jgi:outer membrane protein assembly factor BamA
MPDSGVPLACRSVDNSAHHGRPPFAGAAAAALLLIAIAPQAAGQAGNAQTWPRIVAIELSGNENTQDKVILRELGLAPGDPADPRRIERGTQAVRDLGLFREVEVTTHAVTGGDVVRLRVREKFHLLVLPRLDANSDRDLSYGVQLRWSNLWGLNHRFNLTVASGDYPEERNRREERSVRLGYRAPYVLDSPNDLRVRLERRDRVTPVIDPVTNEVTDDSFDETFDEAEVAVARDLRTDRPRAGWIVGGGLLWQRQDASGDLAPPSDGQALAVLGTADYDDLRFRLYDETGRRFSSRLEAASRGWGSDYGYTRATVGYFESRPVGATPYQTIEMVGSGGVLVGGPGSRNAFSLGGSNRMRGYDSDFLEGDRYYYGSLQYQRPVKWNWLRVIAFAEVGGTGDDREGRRDGSPYADIGVGVRIRLTWFVNVDFQAGVAYPLRGGDGARFFASGD